MSQFSEIRIHSTLNRGLKLKKLAFLLYKKKSIHWCDVVDIAIL